MKTKLTASLLILSFSCVFVLSQLKISQYPNTPVLSSGDLFVLASGSTNKNISWNQLKLILPGGTNSTVNIFYVTNIYATNIYATNIFTTNITAYNTWTTNIYSSNFYTTNIYSTYNYLTNIYASTEYVTNIYVTNGYFTNIYSSYNYLTNIYVSNAYVTNIYVDTSYITNLYVSNEYVTNINAKNLYVTNLLYFETNATTVYTIATNASATTNIVVDLSQPIQLLSLSQSATLLWTTNRPATDTNAQMVMLILDNFSGGNLTLNTNASIGWKIDGTSFPYTLSNGVRHTFTFLALGTSETNVQMGAKWFK